jgi:transposase
VSRPGWLLRDAALGYASRGIPVLPLHHPLSRHGGLQALTGDQQPPSPVGSGCSCRDPGCGQPGKRPLGALVPHGVKDATCNRARVLAWWTRHPQANIGLATGHRFDVLDVDGPEGTHAIRELAAEPGLHSSGPLVRTGGGGWHFCEGGQGKGRCARRRPRPGLTHGTTGVLPSGRAVDQIPGAPPGTTSVDGVTSEEPGLGPRRSTVRRRAVGALPANRRAGRDDMANPPAVAPQVTVGVDSHKDVHVAVAVDQVGRVLGTTRVPTTTRGSAQLLRWATRLGEVRRFGIEGTGSFAAGLSRWLRQQGHEVVEVNRPNRQARRRRGKSDPVDAEAAARAALAGEATATPKAANGTVEMLRVLRVARRSAVKARGQAANQLDGLLVTAPDQLRQQLRGLPLERLVQVAAAFRPGPLRDPLAATKFALRELARRYQLLTAELDQLDAQLAALAPKAAPRLLSRRGVGAQVAGALLVAAGDNPGRLRSEAAFSMLCGSSPLEASSGKTVRHRLNRGGDRDANNALWTIAMTRLSCDERTQRYLARRTAEGKSKREIIRCLKRYIAREVYQDIRAAIAT